MNSHKFTKYSKQNLETIPCPFAENSLQNQNKTAEQPFSVIIFNDEATLMILNNAIAKCTELFSRLLSNATKELHEILAFEHFSILHSTSATLQGFTYMSLL